MCTYIGNILWNYCHIYVWDIYYVRVRRKNFTSWVYATLVSIFSLSHKDRLYNRDKWPCMVVLARCWQLLVHMVVSCLLCCRSLRPLRVVFEIEIRILQVMVIKISLLLRRILGLLKTFLFPMGLLKRGLLRKL